VLSILSFPVVEVLTLIHLWPIQISSWRKEKLGAENIVLNVLPYYLSLMWGVAWPFAWMVRKTMMKKDRVSKVALPYPYVVPVGPL
jgi:hypothetical protein